MRYFLQTPHTSKMTPLDATNLKDARKEAVVKRICFTHGYEEPVINYSNFTQELIAWLKQKNIWNMKDASRQFIYHI